MSSTIVGPDGVPLHSAEAPMPPPPASVRRALDRSREIDGEFVAVPGSEGWEVAAVLSGRRLLGGLLITGALDDEARRSLARARLLVGLLLLLGQQRVGAAAHLDGDLLDGVLDDRPGRRQEARAALTRSGLAPSTPLTVTVVDAPRSARRAIEAIRPIVRARRGLCAVHDGAIVIVCGDDLSDQIATAMLGHGIEAFIGRSSGATVEDGIPWHYRQARDASAAAAALELPGEVTDRRSLGVIGMLLSGARQETVVETISMLIGPILAYDESRGTELAPTLWAFFAANRHLAKAAERLHIHPNTLRQRLDRVDELLGPAWRDHGNSADLLLALRLWRLRGAHLLGR